MTIIKRISECHIERKTPEVFNIDNPVQAKRSSGKRITTGQTGTP